MKMNKFNREDKVKVEESIKWFREIYKKKKRLIDIIMNCEKDKFEALEIPTIHGYKRTMYRIKGYDNLDDLDVCLTTLQPSPDMNMLFIPTIVHSRTITSKTYVDGKVYYDLNDIDRMKYLFEVLWYESSLYDVFELINVKFA